MKVCTRDKNEKKIRKREVYGPYWQGQKVSNPRHAVLETAARTYLYYYRRGVHMVEIRVIGEADELRQAEKAIEQMFDVVDKSKFYDCRSDTDRKRQYIKANIKNAPDK